MPQAFRDDHRFSVEPVGPTRYGPGLVSPAYSVEKAVTYLRALREMSTSKVSGPVGAPSEWATGSALGSSGPARCPSCLELVQYGFFVAHEVTCGGMNNRFTFGDIIDGDDAAERASVPVNFDYPFTTPPSNGAD